MKKFLTLIIGILFLNCFEIKAQAPTYLWAKNFGGPSCTSSTITSTAADKFGNVFITGRLIGTADFDPGPGTTNLVGNCCFIGKYSAAGNLVWIKKLGTGGIFSNDIKSDQLGNIYLTGTYNNASEDFDPGDGVATLDYSNFDSFLAKYDGSGDFLFVKRGHTSSSLANVVFNTIIVDTLTNIVRIGGSIGTSTSSTKTVFYDDVAFDVISNSLTRSTGFNIDYSGNFIATNYDYAKHMAMDVVGNICSVHIYSLFDSNFFKKMDAAGNLLWQFPFPTGLKFTGVSFDDNGNVYVTGYYDFPAFGATINFNPNGAAYQLTAGPPQECFIAKYDNSGAMVWAGLIGNPAQNDQTYTCKVIDNNALYVTGYFSGTADFDFGPATFNLTSTGEQDGFLLKYDLDGNFQFAQKMGPAVVSTEQLISLEKYPTGGFILGGNFTNTSDFDFSAGVASLTAVSAGGGTNAFVGRYAGCSGSPTQPGSISGVTNICQSSENTYSIAEVPGATSYNWTLPSGWLGTSTTNTITATASATGGNISVTASNACGTSGVSSQAITVNATPATPTITSSGSTAICTSGSVTLTSSSTSGNQWYLEGMPISSATSQNYVASTAGNYTVIVTAGTCVSNTSAATSVSVNPLDNVGFIYSAPAYCDNAGDQTPTVTGLAGGTFSSSPSGLSINTSTGTIDMSASIPASYMVTYTTNGICPNSSNVSVTINASTTATVTETACDSYTCTLNGTTYTTSGIYTHVGANAEGCELITTLNLTINSPTSSIDSYNACESFTWIDGNTYTESNNSALYVLPNTAGCDSIVTLNLTINSPTSSIDSHSACDSFTWIDGNTYTESNNSAMYVLPNTAGCDSVVTLNLTINSPTSSIDTHSACDSFTWIDGNTYTESNNSAMYVLPNAAGCDSIVTLNLNITQIDANTNLSGETITANAAGATYQWVNCNNNTPIEGETNQSFTPTTTGSYAVIVSQNDCEEISDCVAVTIISVDEITANEIVIFPNPSSGIFQIQSQERIMNVRVYDALGREIDVEYLAGSNEVDCGKVASGNYIIEVILENKSVRRSFIIQ